MKAAIYARYSTDQQTESSIDDQYRVCTEWCKASGHTVAHRFEDKGISGAAMGNRPGLQSLLAASVELVVVMDLSRLSRSQADLPKMIDRLTHRHVRVVGVQDGYDSSRKGHKVQAGMSGIMGEWFRDMVKEKTYTALETRAKDGRNTGGRAFGYRVQRKSAEKPGELVIDKDQAKWVLKIFEWYAEGQSALTIAKELNRLCVPSPGSSWKREQRRAKHWLAGTISGDPRRGIGILNNDLYRGVYVWNRTSWDKDPDSGKKRCTQRPPSEWITDERPALRIVPQALWSKVKVRQAEQSERLGTAIRKSLQKEMRRGNGRGPKYLFSGWLRCDHCGAPLQASDGKNLACVTYRQGGPSACENGMLVRRDVAEARLLKGIKEHLLRPQRIEQLTRYITRELAERQKRSADDGATQRKRLGELDHEVSNLVDAVSRGELRGSAVLAQRLATAERERDELQAALTRVEPSTRRIVEMVPRAADRARALVASLERNAPTRSLHEIARARADIRALVGGDIRVVGERPAQGGKRRPVALLPVVQAGLLRAAGATLALTDNFGSGGRI